jgi:hypothetical protein
MHSFVIPLLNGNGNGNGICIQLLNWDYMLPADFVLNSPADYFLFFSS